MDRGVVKAEASYARESPSPVSAAAPIPKTSKRRPKTRSKVWEKVAWFTRKTRQGKENKESTPEQARKENKSPNHNFTSEFSKDALQNEQPSNSSSRNVVKTKAKFGVRKSRSFNYLRRRRLKQLDNELSSVFAEETTCQTATGTFHDFVSDSRNSRLQRNEGADSNCTLLCGMAREVHLRNREPLKGSIKAPLLQPMSSLSLNDGGVSHSCHLPSFSSAVSTNNSVTKSRSFSAPTYNSWPRKKRLLVENVQYELLSPPMKQKRVSGLRKAATFSGFDCLKISFSNLNSFKMNMHGRSTPFMSGHSQIKNQNGIAVGVVHFSKSSKKGEAGNAASKAKHSRLHADSNTEAISANEVGMHDPNSGSKQRENGSASEQGFVEFQIAKALSNAEADDMIQSEKQPEHLNCTAVPLGIAYSDDQAVFHTQKLRDIDYSKGLAMGSSLGAVATMKECFVVEDDSEELSVLPDKTKHINLYPQILLNDNNIHHGTITASASSDLGRSGCATEGQTELYYQELCTTEIESHEPPSTPCISPNSDMELYKVSEREVSKHCFDLMGKTQDVIVSDQTDEINQVTSVTVLQKGVDGHTDPALMQLPHNDKDWVLTTKHKSTCPLDDHIGDNVCNPVNMPMLSSKYASTTTISQVSFADDVKSYTATKQPTNSNENHWLSQKEKLVTTERPKVDGVLFKEQTEVFLQWFHKCNDDQKNIIIRKMLESCELPQMHLLSVLMEPVLHKTCPSNCQDMLAWLPHNVTSTVMSYLDPVTLCRCSQVNKLWNQLAGNPALWQKLCGYDEWHLSRIDEKRQFERYTLPSGTIEWKKMLAERFLLRRNWLNGRCKVRTFEGHTQGISCVQFDDTRIVSGSSDKTIKVWDLSRDDASAVLTLAGHSGTVRCLNLNGNRLVSGSVDRSIKVWDLSFESYWSGASCKVTMVGHMHTVRCLQVDDEKVVSGSYDKTLKVWDIKTGNCKLTLRGHNAAVLCVQFDDSKIVSGSYDNTIKVWSLEEGSCLLTLAGHHDAVTCLNLTLDGRKVISGSLDHNLKFWDLATGKCIGTLDWIRSEGHTGVVRCLQSDSWRIVSAGDDKTLKMWSLDSGQRLLTLRCHTDGVTCLQFNDYRIVSGSYDKTVKVWDFSPAHEILNPG